MLQPPNGSGVRPLLSQAGYRLRSIEETLPLHPELQTQLQRAGIHAKPNGAPDALINGDESDHVLVECKASMFGARAVEGGNDSNQRQARAFLLQTPTVLQSALGGTHVKDSALVYITKHNPAHPQSEGVTQLGVELRTAKFSTVLCCVLRLIEHNGGIGIAAAKRGEKWPKRVVAATRSKTDKPVIRLIASDEGGNDLRPLYFMPWMPDCDPEPDEYAKKAFTRRVLGAAVTRIGRTSIGEDAVLRYEEILDEVTQGVFGKWKNREGRKRLHDNARKLIIQHVKKTGALSNGSGDGQSIAVKISEEKIKSDLIKAFRESADLKWNDPEEPTLFDKAPGPEDEEQK